MNMQDITRERLAAQRLVGKPFTSVAETVGFFGGVQSQDHAGAKWALGQRIAGATDATVQAAFDEGKILRVHMLRPTWHYATAADIRWIQQLTSPRVMAMSAYYLRKRNLDDVTLRKSYDALAKILQGRQLTRLELAAELKKAGVDPYASEDRQRFGSILASAEHALVICSGAMRGKQHTYALLDERAPKTAALTRDEALAKLTQTFFTSHGPATVQDFAWWSSLTAKDIQAGLTMSDLQRAVIGSQTYWFVKHTPPIATGHHLHLLPNYDEYTVAYKDRSAILPDAAIDTTKMLDSRGNVLFNNAILYDGHVIGTWRRVIKSKKVLIQPRFLSEPTSAITDAFAEQANRYARFLGMTAELV